MELITLNTHSIDGPTKMFILLVKPKTLTTSIQAQAVTEILENIKDSTYREQAIITAQTINFRGSVRGYPMAIRDSFITMTSFPIYEYKEAYKLPTSSQLRSNRSFNISISGQKVSTAPTIRHTFVVLKCRTLQGYIKLALLARNHHLLPVISNIDYFLNLAAEILIAPER